MKLKTRILILAGSLGLATVLSSCQSTGAGTTAGTEAVMCDKCKTVWMMNKPATLGSPGRMQTTVYRDSKTMTCPDCQLAINNYWKTGSMKHNCATCGGTLAHCTQH
jgi:hypothetical protein